MKAYNCFHIPTNKWVKIRTLKLWILSSFVLRASILAHNLAHGLFPKSSKFDLLFNVSKLNVLITFSVIDKWNKLFALKEKSESWKLNQFNLTVLEKIRDFILYSKERASLTGSFNHVQFELLLMFIIIELHVKWWIAHPRDQSWEMRMLNVHFWSLKDAHGRTDIEGCQDLHRLVCDLPVIHPHVWVWPNKELIFSDFISMISKSDLIVAEKVMILMAVIFIKIY